MPGLTKEFLTNAYSSGKSMYEIGKETGFSVHKITYWMKRFGIQKRSRSDAAYIKLNPNGDPFKIIPIKSIEHASLLSLGIGIYWGEGNKVSPNSVRVTNTDASMLLVFREFLLKICQVAPTKIRYSLICFNDSDVKDVSQHWSDLLDVPISKFGKIVQIPTQGRGTYKRKSQYGVCTITVSNSKLKRWVMDQIQSSARLVQRQNGSMVRIRRESDSPTGLKVMLK